jgi:hypothetical protein
MLHPTSLHPAAPEARIRDSPVKSGLATKDKWRTHEMLYSFRVETSKYGEAWLLCE